MPRKRKTLPKDGLKIIKTMASNGCREVDIASHLGMSWQVFDRIRSESEDVRMAMDRGNAIGHDKVMGRLFEEAVNGNIIAAIFLAKVKYGYRENIDVSHHSNVRISFDMPGALPQSAYEKLINPPERIEDGSKKV